MDKNTAPAGDNEPEEAPQDAKPKPGEKRPEGRTFSRRGVEKTK